MSIAVLGLPFLIYLHLLFSVDNKVVSLFNLQIYHSYPSNQVFAWAVLKSLIPLALMLALFFSTRQSWKFFILPLISIFTYSVFGDLFYSHLLEVNSPILTSLVIVFIFNLLIVGIDNFVSRKYRIKIVQESVNILLATELASTYKNHLLNVKSVLQKRNEILPAQYLRKMIYTKRGLEKLLYFNSNSELNDFAQQKKQVSDVQICIILFLTSSLWFVHYFVPDGVKQINVGFMVVESNGFPDVDVFIWFLCYKLLILIPMILWFVISKQWWKYAILSPILVFTYQFWEAFQDEQLLDAYGNMRIFPAVFLVILIVWILSRTIKYRIAVLDANEFVINEIEELLTSFGNSNVKIKDCEIRYRNLKHQFNSQSGSKEYIKKLIKLREELSHLYEI